MENNYNHSCRTKLSLKENSINYSFVSDNIEIDNTEDLDISLTSDNEYHFEFKSNELSLAEEIRDVEMELNSNRIDFINQIENSSVLNESENNEPPEVIFDNYSISKNDTEQDNIIKEAISINSKSPMLEIYSCEASNISLSNNSITEENNDEDKSMEKGLLMESRSFVKDEMPYMFDNYSNVDCNKNEDILNNKSYTCAFCGIKVASQENCSNCEEYYRDNKKDFDIYKSFFLFVENIKCKSDIFSLDEDLKNSELKTNSDIEDFYNNFEIYKSFFLYVSDLKYTSEESSFDLWIENDGMDLNFNQTNLETIETIDHSGDSNI